MVAIVFIMYKNIGGTDNLQQNIEQAKFPFLCANVFQKDGLNLDIKPYVVLEDQGVKIAVVGMIEIRHDGIPGAHPSKLTQVGFKKAIDVSAIPFAIGRQKKDKHAHLLACLEEAKAAAADPTTPRCTNPDKLEEFLFS